MLIHPTGTRGALQPGLARVCSVTEHAGLAKRRTLEPKSLDASGWGGQCFDRPITLRYVIDPRGLVLKGCD